MTIKTSDVMRDIAQGELEGKSIVLPSGAMLSVKACQHGRVTLSINDTVLENAPLREARVLIEKHCQNGLVYTGEYLRDSDTMDYLRERYLNAGIISLSVLHDCISHDGATKIIKYLDNHEYHSDWFAGMDWRTNDLMARIKKIIALHGMIAYDSVMGEVGNLIARHSIPRGEVYFDLVDKFDWESGDFGDSGSCYWGCHAGARVMLENDNAMAIRFYRKDNEGEYEGIGRAWIVEYEGLAVVYNAYEENRVGMYSPFATLERYASTLAYLVNCETKRVSLTNNGSDTGELWINSGRGIAIGHYRGSSIDLEIGEEEDENRVQCESCGTWLDMDMGDYYATDWGVYCDECYHDRYGYCEKCEEGDIPRDDLVQVNVHTRWGTDTQTWCEYCVRTHSFECNGCNEHFDDNMDSVEVDGDCYCEHCQDEYLRECQHCENVFEKHGGTEKAGDWLCWECFEEVATVCHCCDSAILKTDSVSAVRQLDWEGKFVWQLDIDGQYRLCSQCAETALPRYQLEFTWEDMVHEIEHC